MSVKDYILASFKTDTSQIIPSVIKMEWKTITGFSNYQISNTGIVRSISLNRELKLTSDKEGYLFLGIMNNNKKRCNCRVSRLVATAFIENPDNKPEVDHIDRNPKNNNVSNLRWATRQENNNNRGAFSNTNEKHISKVVVEQYYVAVLGHRTKMFYSLEEAVAHRDSILNK